MAGRRLGTCDVVSMVVDSNAQRAAGITDWSRHVVRDGIVWEVSSAPSLSCAAISLPLNSSSAAAAPRGDLVPPGTDPRISINVLESAGLEVQPCTG